MLLLVYGATSSPLPSPIDCAVQPENWEVNNGLDVALHVFNIIGLSQKYMY